MTEPTTPDYRGYPQQPAISQQLVSQQSDSQQSDSQQQVLVQQPGRHLMPAPKRPHKNAWVLGIGGAVVVCIVGGILIFGAGGSSTAKRQRAANDDVKISHCGAVLVSGATTGDATVTVTNSGNDSADYIVTVAYMSPDGSTQYDTGFTTVNELAPGQMANLDAPGFKKIPDTFICKIASVDRS